MASEQADACCCDLCHAPIPDGGGVDYYGLRLCDACDAAERAVFEVCQHDWDEPDEDPDGRPARLCRKCNWWQVIPPDVAPVAP